MSRNGSLLVISLARRASTVGDILREIRGRLRLQRRFVRRRLTRRRPMPPRITSGERGGAEHERVGADEVDHAEHDHADDVRDRSATS